MKTANSYFLLFLIVLWGAGIGRLSAQTPVSSKTSTTISSKTTGTIFGNIQMASNGKPLVGATINLIKIGSINNNAVKPASPTISSALNSTASSALNKAPNAVSNKMTDTTSSSATNDFGKTVSSDKRGSFIFDKVPFGIYRLKITNISFANLTIDSIGCRPEKDEVVLNDIQVKDSVSTLNEVVVYADKKLIEEKDGVLTYNVSESPISNGSSTSDLLKNIPLVAASSDGTITVKGKVPLILIDEKPTNLNAQQLADLLESLPASVIEKVEVMQTPPPEFATYDGAVINIVSKKGRTGLYQRYALSGGTRGEGNATTSINYKSARFSMNSNINVGQSKVFGDSWSQRQNIYKDSVSYFYNKSDFQNNNWRPNLRIQSEYTFDKKRSMELVYQGNSTFFDNVTHTQYTNLDSAFRIWKASNRTINYNGNSYNHGLNGTYQWKGNNKAEKLNIYTGINWGKNDNGKDFYQQYLLPNLLPSGLDSSQNQQFDNYSTSYYLNINYNKPLNDSAKKIFTTGVTFNESVYHNILNANFFNKIDNNFYTNDLLSNNFFFTQGIVTARVGLLFILKKGWRINAGEQAEYTIADFNFVKGNAVNANSDYWRLLPNITLRKQINSTLSSSFTLRETIRRPGIVELNPSIDFSDPYNVRFGNPFLKPSLTQNIDLNLSYNAPKFNINSSIGFNKVKEVFSSVRTLISTGRTQTTFQNISDQSEYTANFWSGVTVTRKFKFNVSAGFNYNQYGAAEKTLYRYVDGGSNYIGVNCTYIPNNLTSFESSNRYNNYANPQGKTRSNINMTLSAQRKLFNKKVVINFAAIDPLGLTKYFSYTAGSNFNINSYNASNTRNFRITISYQFNKTYLHKNKDNGLDKFSSKG